MNEELKPCPICGVVPADYVALKTWFESNPSLLQHEVERLRKENAQYRSRLESIAPVDVEEKVKETYPTPEEMDNKWESLYHARIAEVDDEGDGIYSEDEHRERIIYTVWAQFTDWLKNYAVRSVIGKEGEKK